MKKILVSALIASLALTACSKPAEEKAQEAAATATEAAQEATAAAIAKRSIGYELKLFFTASSAAIK